MYPYFSVYSAERICFRPRVGLGMHHALVGRPANRR